MTTFLLEIGTEELPADFARLVIPQLEEFVKTDLQSKRLTHGEIKCSSTPRRISLTIDSLSESANDLEVEHKGPPFLNAFVNGSPTKAAIGFAKRFGVTPESLEIKETSKGSFLYFKTLEKGEPSILLLEKLIPQWITRLQGRRFMRWGAGELRFSRPIRWLVVLLGSQTIPINIIDTDQIIPSGSVSRGHRLFSQSIKITSANDYFSALSASGVFALRNERKQFIKESIFKVSNKLNLIPDLPEDLLEELTDLVESPSIVVGEFANEFLELPPEVLRTVMRVHQRYIPLRLEKSIEEPLALNSKKELSPKFICVTNSLSSASETVRTGNQRVLKARLADAQFFINSDLAISSLERCKKLAEVSFSEGLGSLEDRVKRIVFISSCISSKLNIDQITSENIKKSAELCKHDLVSQMVGEFPELQGIIGSKYLLSEGFSSEISLAVQEHYLPRSSGGCLPSSIEGSVVAISERIELLVSIFAKGLRPSGSSDPYALRRAANGLLQIIWSNSWSIDLNFVLNSSLDNLINKLPSLNINKSELLIELSGFFKQRIYSLFEESDLDVDLIQSICGSDVEPSRLTSDPYDAKRRINILKQMRISGQLKSVHMLVARASKISQKGALDYSVVSPKDVVNENLFEKRSEKDVLELINKLEPIVISSSENKYQELIDVLSSGSTALSDFFDGEGSVLVMSENLEVRKNRLNLLSVLRNQANILADFSKLTG